MSALISPSKIVDHFNLPFSSFRPESVISSFRGLSADQMALVLGQLIGEPICTNKQGTYDCLMEAFKQKVSTLEAGSDELTIANSFKQFAGIE